MHLGATLRLLRLDSGMGLRDLARRLNVSGSYLSRVEKGLDSAPTPSRLQAIARALEIPAPLLLNVAHRVSPLVVDYVEDVPEAGMLFSEIAERRLSASELSELRELLNARFPARAPSGASGARGISDLLTPSRIILGFRCSSIDDVFDIAVERLGAGRVEKVFRVASAMKQREREVSSGIGGGIAVPCAYTSAEAPAAVLVSLAKPLEYDTPDQRALRLIIVLAGPRGSVERRACLAHVARLASRGLCEKLANLEAPEEVVAALRLLEGHAAKPARARREQRSPKL